MDIHCIHTFQLICVIYTFIAISLYCELGNGEINKINVIDC